MATQALDSGTAAERFAQMVASLGGGRARPGDRIDPRVGLAQVVARGAQVHRGDPLAFVHAADESAAEVAIGAVLAAVQLGAEAPGALPLVAGLIDA